MGKRNYELLANRDAEIKRLKDDIEAGLNISGSFFEALKLLNLSMLNVADPGSHVRDVIIERDRLRAMLVSRDKLLAAHRRFHGKVGCPGDDCSVCNIEESVLDMEASDG